MFTKDKLSENAKGGTEMMKTVLSERLPKELQDNFQVFVSRVESEYNPEKIRLYYAHDLPDDPESVKALGNGKWENFHRLVFVSNHQQQNFIKKFNLPWSKCIVLKNAIEPISAHDKPKDKIRLGYWSTPHRGLNILLPVFEELSKKYDTLELDVFSSFNLYGWSEKDKDYEELFDVCKNHPKINYHGTVDNIKLREAIKDIHILAYPNTWEETSCITLLEAMSGGCLAVHPNYGALPETAANWTLQYQYDERPNNHAAVLHSCLDTAITEFWSDSVQSRIASAKPYTDLFYNWNHRINQWEAFLTSLLNEPRELPKKVYRFDSRG